MTSMKIDDEMEINQYKYLDECMNLLFIYILFLAPPILPSNLLGIGDNSPLSAPIQRTGRGTAQFSL